MSSKNYVTVYVGPQRAEYYLNEELLCDKVDFFRAAFRGSFTESHNKTLSLPEDDPTAFARLIGWLHGVYTPCDEAHGAHPSPTISHDMLWIDLFILADKMNVKDLANRGMNQWRWCNIDHSELHYIDRSVVDHVYSHTAIGSRAREEVLKVFIRYYFRDENQPTKFWNLVRDNQDAQLDCFTAIGKHLGELYCGHNNVISTGE